MAYPTRPDPIPLADRRYIIGNTFQVTLVPQVPPEERELYTLNIKDMIEHFNSDPSLEGILHVDTPEKSTTVFYVVFSGISDIEQNEARMNMYSKSMTYGFDDTTDPTKQKQITFKVRRISLSTLQETNRSLFDWVWAQIADALTIGKASAYGVTWEAMPGQWYTSTPKDTDLSKLVSEMQRQGDSILLDVYQALKKECDNRHLIPGTGPLPGESFIDTEKLGEAIAGLLREAREIEEELKPSNPTESTSEKKKNGKAKVASAQVAPGLDSQGNLEKLAKAAAACQQQQETAQKLINELVKTLTDL